MILDYLLLPMLFFIGLVTSYQDFYYGKIRNKWIILGLVWGVGALILLLIWSQAAQFLAGIYGRHFDYIYPSYILKMFINSSISFVVGYTFWYFELWSAGDAKLFLSYLCFYR